MVFDGMTIDEEVFKELQANITRRMTPQPVRIRADIEVTCFSSEGIDAIKAALSKAEALETEDIPIKVKLVAPPLYVLLTTTTDKQGGIELVEKAVDEIASSITSAGGELKVKMKVCIFHVALASAHISISPRRCLNRRTKSWSSLWRASNEKMPKSKETTIPTMAKAFRCSGTCSAWAVDMQYTSVIRKSDTVA